ncbi:AfsR/SARP family transcriptional regulator [Nonomuraea turcica]|uniref:AfsR/SARP family transcriptional regulator n=1 Tax=Nonomuraea sp. G32 TaxID=3067274 RepID=UPI00273B6E6D|nr:BTAD domain-containing putative transcriptional regulator [Nonomuraea sp. G32]MDP4503000.1 BTAD domain-containing putative transcriptional regulator [Nonomuraea sp. G32]
MRNVVVGVLGPVGLVRDGALHAPPAPVLRALLGLLASASTPIAAQALIDVVWRHDPPRDPKGALYLAACRLRAWLRESDTDLQIVTDANGYYLDLGESASDLGLFRREAARSDATFQSLSQALGLWRGRPFTNVPARRVDTRLVKVLLTERDAVIRRSAQVALDEGRPALAIKLIQPLCHSESLDEAAHAILMTGLTTLGQQGSAIQVFDTIRRRLATELGIGPGTQLQQAHTDSLGRRQSRPRTRLLGRAIECEQIGALLAEHRLVTVIGPPGVGKTRLTAEIALTHPGGRYVRLSDFAGDDAARRIVAKHADAGATLLAIDGCDDRLDLVAQLTQPFLAGNDSTAVLIAANRPLGLSGEATWVTRPLDKASCEKLFRLRATQAVPGLSFSSDDQSYVRSLCGQADGIPAVVEFLASLLRALPLATLAASDLSSLMDATAPFAKSLDAAWDELTEPEQTLLLQAAALGRQFSLESLTAQPLNALAALVDRGLVLSEETPAGRRYRLLAPIRTLMLATYADRAPGGRANAHPDRPVN